MKMNFTPDLPEGDINETYEPIAKWIDGISKYYNMLMQEESQKISLRYSLSAEVGLKELLIINGDDNEVNWYDVSGKTPDEVLQVLYNIMGLEDMIWVNNQTKFFKYTVE